MTDMTLPPQLLNPNHNVFAMLWLWGRDLAQATRFDTWQDAVLALEHAPPVWNNVNIEAADDGEWIARTRFRGPDVYLTPEVVMYPPASPA